MPFINGRFYMNPAYGRAIEKARMASEGEAWLEDNPEPMQQAAPEDDFWDDAPAGKTPQGEDGRWVTINGRHVLIHEAQARRQTLTRAQDAAIHNPKFIRHGGTTYCNEATCSVAKAVGAPMRPLTDARGNPLKADQIGANLAKPGSGYKPVSADQAQQLANQGELVIVAGPGHVATVRSDNGQPVVGHGPIVANVGRGNGVVRLSYVFTHSAMPAVKFYTPNQ